MQYEEARDAGDLLVCDTKESLLSFTSRVVTCFVSHQWLGFKEPDPNRSHFVGLRAALLQVCQQYDFESEQLYIWIDYTSIPQCNRHTQSLAIRSIAHYIAGCRFFLSLVPPSMHANTHDLCNEESYMSRGWCRMEQWARLAVCGTKRFCRFDGASLIPLHSMGKEELMVYCSNAIEVFNGHFTMEDDKHELVDLCLSLWAQTLCQLNEPEFRWVHDLVCQSPQKKEATFPRRYFNDMVLYLEETLKNGMGVNRALGTLNSSGNSQVKQLSSAAANGLAETISHSNTEALGAAFQRHRSKFSWPESPPQSKCDSETMGSHIKNGDQSSIMHRQNSASWGLGAGNYATSSSRISSVRELSALMSAPRRQRSLP
eukprot:CAMPEP_0119324354 /NCGR_PEP_ID=MMETSP1333-20130426/62969_1 /TAXON_ID=418940 /ORGANISM="Scyphosphaera apsteinii, Strain RCC1455" /LENGTH=371 /DNA_ID=CAMNT_0007332037 /DNA_START=140 /DNA_END=1255 /DNA_ORIENTATION=-